MQLNPQQLAASNFTNGVCAVVAVPGSGKTLTMTKRIANLIIKHRVPPESILGLTFTRSAAKAMQDKLKPMLNAVADRVALKTIHGFAYNFLMEEGLQFELLHSVRQIRYIRDLMKAHKVRALSPGMILREITLAKNNNIPAQEFKQLYPDDNTMQLIAQVYIEYERKKKQDYLFDFNDLLTETQNLLKQSPDIREKYQATYRHILVDEFQDTVPVQTEIFKYLISKNGDSSFYATGDDWQAIFGFIGASAGNLVNFNKVYPDSSQYILDTNYRSTPQILTACANLIQHNHFKVEKELRTDNPDGTDVIVIEAGNSDDEATQICNEIQELITGEYKHHDIAILYRANHMSRAVEDALTKAEIPYYIENGQSFYERREVKILLDYLRLINEPLSVDGDDALKCCINAPNRYIGKKFLTELEEYANAEDIDHLYEALRTKPVTAPYLKRNVSGFIKLIDGLHKIRGKTTPAEMLSMLRETLDYDSWISEDDVPSPDDSLIANLNELQIAASKYKDIESFINYVDTFREIKRNDKTGVCVMTMHKAKGLEFPAVFCIGFIDGLMPNCMGDIEEERRIAFVGISRAMKLLYVSYATTYNGKSATVSPFLSELLNKQS